MSEGLIEKLVDGRTTTCRVGSSAQMRYQVLALGLGVGTALLTLAHPLET